MYEDSPKAFTKLLEAIPELRKSTLRTTFGFSGESRTKLTIPPSKGTVELENAETLDVEWQGLTGVLEVAANAEAYAFSLDAPLVGVKEKDTGMIMQGLSMTCKSKLHGQNLYLGDSTLSISDLHIEDTKAATKLFSLSHLAITANSDQRNDVVDGIVACSGEGVDLKSQSKASFETIFSLKNIDVTALDTLVGEFRRISRQRAAPDVLIRELRGVLLRQGGVILSKRPRFAVEKCVLRVPAGAVEASGFVAYSGTGELPENSLAALRLLTVSAKAKASEQALMDILVAVGKDHKALAGPEDKIKAEMAVRDMTAKGFAVRDKDSLFTAADWNGKEMTVNGKVLFQMP
jgi:uncharacterized protein YdgA (DUF945 family)